MLHIASVGESGEARQNAPKTIWGHAFKHQRRSPGLDSVAQRHTALARLQAPKTMDNDNNDNDDDDDDDDANQRPQCATGRVTRPMSRCPNDYDDDDDAAADDDGAAGNPGPEHLVAHE